MQRYGVVYADIWQDDDYKRLTVEARYVYLYLLSSPHSNMAGFYKLPDAYAAYDLGMQEYAYVDAVSELEEKGFVFTNGDYVLIRSYLKHNPILNDKQAKGAWNCIDRIPLSHLTVEFVHGCLLYAPSVIQFLSKEVVRYLYDNHVTRAGIDISSKLMAFNEQYRLLTETKTATEQNRTESIE